ncbi:Uncharacterised protein [Chlamydia trachomatis]|nr:Uncharacterised protein [Chlamydia trachomatis]
MVEEISAFQVGASITTKNHIRGSHRKHVLTQLVAMYLVFLDLCTLVSVFCSVQHAMHGSDQETRGASARVEHGIGRLHLKQITKKLANVGRGKHNTKGLTIPTGITHEL